MSSTVNGPVTEFQGILEILQLRNGPSELFPFPTSVQALRPIYEEHWCHLFPNARDSTPQARTGFVDRGSTPSAGEQGTPWGRTSCAIRLTDRLSIAGKCERLTALCSAWAAEVCRAIQHAHPGVHTPVQLIVLKEHVE